MVKPVEFLRIGLPEDGTGRRAITKFPLPSAAAPADPAVRAIDETLDSLPHLPAQQPARRVNREIQRPKAYSVTYVSKY